MRGFLDNSIKNGWSHFWWYHQGFVWRHHHLRKLNLTIFVAGLGDIGLCDIRPPSFFFQALEKMHVKSESCDQVLEWSATNRLVCSENQCQSWIFDPDTKFLHTANVSLRFLVSCSLKRNCPQNYSNPKGWCFQPIWFFALETLGLYIYIPAYLHTCIPAYLHTCIPAYLHTCIHAYMHTCIHAYMHTCIHAYMHTCIHAYMHTCIHAYMHTCIHAYIHAYMHTCIHAYMHTYIHTYIQMHIKCTSNWQLISFPKCSSSVFSTQPSWSHGFFPVLLGSQTLVLTQWQFAVPWHLTGLFVFTDMFITTQPMNMCFWHNGRGFISEEIWKKSCFRKCEWLSYEMVFEVITTNREQYKHERLFEKFNRGSSFLERTFLETQ